MKFTGNDLLNEKSLPRKIYMLLEVVKEKNIDNETITQIGALTNEDSTHMRLGKVFGHSVSDYAFAALKWLDTEYSIKTFDNLFTNLPNDRKKWITELIKSEAYKQV